MLMDKPIIYSLLLCDKISMPIWITTSLCLGVVLLIYGRSIPIFIKEKKYLRLILLSICLIALCASLLLMCYGYYKR